MAFTRCSCNTFSIVGSGGLRLGGAGTLTTREVGGVVLSGEGWLDRPGVPLYGVLAWYPLTADYHDLVSGQDGTGNTSEDDGVLCLHSQLFEGAEQISLPMPTPSVFTLSFWVRLDTVLNRTLIEWGNLNVGTSILGHVCINDTYYTTKVLMPNRWYLVSVVSDGAEVKLYLDGIMQDSGELAITTASTAWVGRSDDGSYSFAAIQDLRVEEGTRNAEYCLTQYNDYCDVGFYVVGEVESPTVWVS